MAFFHVFELSIKEFRESDFGRKSKTLFDHGRCIARQGRRQVEASAREWTCVHDRSGDGDLARDCPQDTAAGKRYSTTADVSRGKVAGKLRRQQGNGLVSMTAEDNETCQEIARETLPNIFRVIGYLYKKTKFTA